MQYNFKQKKKVMENIIETNQTIVMENKVNNNNSAKEDGGVSTLGLSANYIIEKIKRYHLKSLIKRYRRNNEKLFDENDQAMFNYIKKILKNPKTTILSSANTLDLVISNLEKDVFININKDGITIFDGKNQFSNSSNNRVINYIISYSNRNIERKIFMLNRRKSKTLTNAVKEKLKFEE